MPFGLKKENKSNVDFKARVERKLCIARESPEPIFDVSECNLKTVPNGVYSLCKVFRKEALYLHENILTTLSGGGNLKYLELLKVLDVHSNKLTKLPSDIGELSHLEVLNVSNNELTALPTTIGSLQYLINLNTSSNKLQSLPSTLGDCSLLQVLNIKDNKHLKKLPAELGKLKCLTELSLSASVEYPPQSICSQGSLAVVQFLATECGSAVDLSCGASGAPTSAQATLPPSLAQYDALQEKLKLFEKAKEEKRAAYLSIEDNLANANQKEIQAHQSLQQDKTKLVEDLLQQQRCLEADIAKVQLQKDKDRALLLHRCYQVENEANEVVALLVNNTKSAQQKLSWLAEQNKMEEQLLFNLNTSTKSMDKAVILKLMEETVQEEVRRAEKLKEYAAKRVQTTESLLSEESLQSEKLSSLVRKADVSHAELVDSIKKYEELQKTAVASLLERSDARSWELTQQVAVVQVKLAQLTRLEMKRKQLEADSHIVELSHSRRALTKLLMELFTEQSKRRSELVQSLQHMESMRTNDSSNTFWLEQYQRLMESRSLSLVESMRAIGSDLASELIIAGVFHYLPLLANLLSTQQGLLDLSLQKIADAGVRDEDDQALIMKAVRQYLKSESYTASAPEDTEASAPVLTPRSSDTTPAPLVSDDCVVCLDAVCDVIFMPCGHVCCCSTCSSSLRQCPLCRSPLLQFHSFITKR